YFELARGLIDCFDVLRARRPLMTPRALARDVGLIAAFDLRESLRTRRALMLILLYLAAAAICAYVYLQIVHKSEEAIAAALAGQRGVQGLGASLGASLARDQAYRKALAFFADGDSATVEYLAGIPPVVLVFLWSSLTFLPWIVALTSYDQIAADVHLRTVR